jgi:hypothetical protein
MKLILEKALSHKCVLPNMEVVLNPKVLRFGNPLLDRCLKNCLPFFFILIKKGLAYRSHSSSCSKAGCSSMATVSGLLYKSMSFFTASESEKHTLNSDNKFSVLEAKVEN